MTRRSRSLADLDQEEEDEQHLVAALWHGGILAGLARNKRAYGPRIDERPHFHWDAHARRLSDRSPGGPRAKRYFVERKNHFCILCTGICDSDRRFTFYDMSFEPQTHDSLAWVGTPLGQRFEETLSLHDKGYFFNGDNAYLGGKCMIVPGGSDAFDFYQSSNRMSIECASSLARARNAGQARPN